MVRRQHLWTDFVLFLYSKKIDEILLSTLDVMRRLDIRRGVAKARSIDCMLQEVNRLERQLISLSIQYSFTSLIDPLWP